MPPEPSTSPIRQAESGVLPSPMFTMVISSFTVTTPLPSQSPVQAAVPTHVPPALPSALTQSLSSTHAKPLKSPPSQTAPVDWHRDPGHWSSRRQTKPIASPPTHSFCDPTHGPPPRQLCVTSQHNAALTPP